PHENPPDPNGSSDAGTEDIVTSADTVTSGDPTWSEEGGTVLGGDGPVATNILETLTFSTGQFPVDPFHERTQRRYTLIDRTDPPYVVRYAATMTEGSHHFNMYFAKPSDVPPALLGQTTDCQQLLSPYLTGSQWTHIDESFPTGFAVKIPAPVVMIL